MENTTITVSDKVWKKLSLIKINAGYNTIDEVLRDLLFRKTIGDKKEEQNGNN